MLTNSAGGGYSDIYFDFFVAERGSRVECLFMNQIDLAHQSAIVTGGARGIGFAISQRLLQSGAAVCLWDRDVEALKDAEQKLAPFGQVHGVTVDVTDEKSVQSAVDATVARLGFISILVNNAGIGGWKTVRGYASSFVLQLDPRAL